MKKQAKLMISPVLLLAQYGAVVASQLGEPTTLLLIKCKLKFSSWASYITVLLIGQDILYHTKQLLPLERTKQWRMMSYVSFVKLAIAMSVPLVQYLTAKYLPW